MKLLCKIGFHKWWPEINNLFGETTCFFRTYMRCKKCGVYGALVFFGEIDTKTGKETLEKIEISHWKHSSTWYRKNRQAVRNQNN